MAPINYKGKKYTSIKELAKVLGIKAGTLGYRIRQNWPEDDWAREMIYGVAQNNIGIEYQGKKFESVKGLARHLGVPYIALRGRIERNEPQEIWGRPSRRGGPVEHGQVVYPTMFDLAKKIADDNDLDAGACYRKLKESLDQGVDLDEAVVFASENHNKLSVEYLGDTYDSLTALSRYLDIHLVTLRERILKEWPEEMWAADKLPTQSPDFYFAIDNPEKIKRSCSVYVVGLRRFPEYQKIGIAVSPTHRRDAEYGEEQYVKKFANRLEALIFEGAILSITQSDEGYPDELVPPCRKNRWHGITELRKMPWSELKNLIKALEVDLDDQGFEDIAMRFIPMSERQRTQLAHTLVLLENEKRGQIDT